MSDAAATREYRNQYAAGLRNWCSVMGALIIREIWSYGESKWTLFLLLLEPVGVIAVFGSISYFLLRVPPYGPSIVLFHATGIIPFYYYMRISARTRGFSTDWGTRWPCIHPLDEFLTLVVLEFIIMSAATVLVLGGLAIFDIPMAAPFDPWACICAVLFISLLACGINLVHSAISQVTEAWVSVLIVTSRGMILVSGVFFVTDFVPPNIRYWLTLNPLAHAIMWFRMGIYPRYPIYSLDRSYLALTAFFSLVLGLVVERAMRSFKARYDHS